MSWRNIPLLAIAIIFLSCATNSSTDRKSSYPALSGRVVDNATLIDASTKKRITDELAALEKDIGSQIVVLTINSLPDEMTIEQYSMNLAEQWRIGRAEYDDGIIITVAHRDRKVRIEVGYGLENIIRDEIAARIIEQDMIPEFRKGNFGSGLEKATHKIDSLIRVNEHLVGSTPQ